MSARRVSLLISLLLTAVLLYALPGLLWEAGLRDTNRMDERLRPARARTVTVWLMADDMGDRKLLNELCAAFEAEHEGVRVFMRTVPMQELTAANAVLPDVVLYQTGGVTNPEQRFVPIAGTEAAGSSGMSGGVRYGVQLWFAPNVLSLPMGWMNAGDAPSGTPMPSSFFDLGTPAPTQGQEESPAIVAVDDLPWGELLASGALALPQGVGLMQLLYVCPAQLRTELQNALNAPTDAAPLAMVQTVAKHNAAVRAGQALAACALPPAVCDRVRYLSLCNNEPDTLAFAAFATGSHAQAAALRHDMLPALRVDAITHQPLAALCALYENGLLFPNAYAHSRQELDALLLDAFWRNQDPVETLLRTR